MLTKKVKSRMIFLIISFLLASIMIFVILRSLEKNVVYFFSPSEIYSDENISFDEKIRVGGLVKINSISKSGEEVNFIIQILKMKLLYLILV